VHFIGPQPDTVERDKRPDRGMGGVTQNAGGIG